MRPMPNNENFPSKIFNFSLDIAAPQNINYGCVSIVTKFQNFALVERRERAENYACQPRGSATMTLPLFFKRGPP